MKRFRVVCLLLALICAASLGVYAAEVDCDSTYCFSKTDFHENENLTGVCITGLPDANAGTVMLGARVIRSGDILTAQQLTQLTFCPLRTETDGEAQVTYLPIFSNRVEPSTTMTISIRGKEDKAPVAEDSSIETYKNLPNQGKLKVSDPEGQTLIYTLTRKPRRGEVILNDDGTFTYTPKKNKVGVDSFTYTATDPAGHVSREATVTIQILKPTDSRQYTDTVGSEYRFAAEWMRNTGLFVGEKVGGKECFYPEKTVTRGEFLTMVVDALDIPLEDTAYSAVPSDTPLWLKPYLAAAIRSGLTAGLPEQADGCFHPEEPITGAEAAVMLQNALDLSISQKTVETAATEQSDAVPAWAQVSLTTLADHGITMDALSPLTRGQTAQVLYTVTQLAIDAPGMYAIRMQQ